MSETITLAELRAAPFGRTDEYDTSLLVSVGAWMTPIANRVNDLMDIGRDVYIWGFSPDESHVLIVDRDNNTVSVAHVNTVASLGRWECLPTHLSEHTDVYWPRFPKR